MRFLPQRHRGALPARLARLGRGVALAVIAACWVAALYAGGNAETTCLPPVLLNPTCQTDQVVDIAWSSHALPVRWWMNQDGARNNTEHRGQPLDPGKVLSELQASFAAWESLPESSITFSSQGTTSVATGGADNLNLVYWSDTDLPSLTLAVTTLGILKADWIVGPPGSRNVDLDPDEELDSNIYPNDTRLRAGTIFDADIALNSRDFDWSLEPDPIPNVIDIRAVATHEAGHFHGLTHSVALRDLATMFDFFDSTSTSQQQAARSLEWDDVAASARTYPESGVGPSGALIGRVVRGDGTTAGVVGAQVSAIDAATGREVEAVFTNSDRKVGGGGAGSYRLDRLPPGQYMIAVDYLRRAGQTNTGWRWFDAEKTSYSVTVGLDEPGHLDPSYVSPELLSSPEHELDDNSPALVVSLAVGEQRILPDLVANEPDPDALGGTSQLLLADNGTAGPIPIGSPVFPFSFYGVPYTEFIAYANGYLTFGTSFDRFFDENGGNFFDFPRVAGLLRDLDPGADGLTAGGPDVYVRLGSSSVETTWLALPEKVPKAETGSPAPTPFGANTFTIGFDATGRVWIDYKRLASPLGIAGIAAGDGLIGVVEKYDFGRPRPFFTNRPTLENAVRLSGVHLDFTPHPLGGYVPSSPQWKAPEAAPPGGVGALRAEGDLTTRLSWPAADALGYNVYRGRVENLLATGTYTDENSCFASLSGTQATDVEDPGAGRAYFYLVTAFREFGIEGSLGKNSRGIGRPNAVPCRAR